MTKVLPTRNPIMLALVTGLMAMPVQAGERDPDRLQDGAVERLVYAP